MSTAAAAVVVMVAIPMVMLEVGSEVTLVIPPPIVVEEERRETRLPTSPGGGAHGLPSWLELEGPRGYVARPKVGHLLASHGVQVVEIP